MKRVVLLIVSAFLFLTCHAEEPQTQRKRVAVVLSGGGAKGMAHIGVLRVLERAGVPVDIITGTSMGSLIGGLYSIGYDAATLDSLVKAQDWGVLLSDRADTRTQSIAERDKQRTYILSRPLSINLKKANSAGGLIAGSNLSKLFARLTVGYHDSIDFKTLPIPFACVATDIVKNTEHDFFSGYLSEAMRASMAIPGVFTPVRKDSMVLVDGGLRNNYPADLARQMGADIIIGVTVQSDGRTADDLQSSADILMQIVDINCKNKFDANLAMTDIPIRVDVKGYSSASFTRTAIDSLIIRGERAAMQQWDKLEALGRSLAVSDGQSHGRERRGVPSEATLKMSIDTVTFERILPSDSRYIAAKYGLTQQDSLPVNRIEQAMTDLSENYLYTNVGYSVVNRDGKHILQIGATDKRTSRINLGVRFDTEEIVALQANLSHQLHTFTPLNLEFTGRLGKRMMARLDAWLTPIHYGKVGLSYIFRHDDMNVYSCGDRDYNFTYNQHAVQLRLLTLNFRNFALDMGVHADFYDFHDVLSSGAVSGNAPSNVDLYSYHFRLNYDSENKWFFTTRGARFTAGYAYYTDNFVGWNKHTGISVTDVMWRMSFAINSRLTLRPVVCGRFVADGDIPFILRNSIGGTLPGQYLEHQLPFAGIGHVEFIDDMFLSVGLTAQQRIMDNNYVMARLSLAQHNDKLKRLFRHGPMTGCEAAYYYNSVFGPVGASLGYSSRTHQPYFYINLGYQF